MRRSSLSTVCRAVAGATVLLLVPNAFSAVLYDEAVSPDLSNSGLAPTFLSIASESNQVFGSTGSFGSGMDRDYFSVTIPDGYQLSAMRLLSATGISGSVSFVGVQAGPQVTLGPNPSSAAGLLGWVHYSRADIGTDILPKMGVPAGGSTGFAPPLGSATYSFWVQDNNGGRVPYGFDLVMTAVPEPNGLALALAGLVAVGVMSRRSRRRLVPTCA